jgi:hypothetical protein
MRSQAIALLVLAACRNETPRERERETVAAVVEPADAAPIANADSSTPSTREPEPPTIDVTAQRLLADFHANEIAADAKYRDKVLRVSGRIAQIGKDVLDQPFVAFTTSNAFDSVQAVFGSADGLGALQRGQSLTVRCRRPSLSLGSVVLAECSLEPTSKDIAHSAVLKIANETYGAWAADNPTRACPKNYAELTRYAPDSINDPWGQPYRILCNPQAPTAKRLRVFSNGPDRKPDTADDIKSWERPRE